MNTIEFWTEDDARKLGEIISQPIFQRARQVLLTSLLDGLPLSPDPTTDGGYHNQTAGFQKYDRELRKLATPKTNPREIEADYGIPEEFLTKPELTHNDPSY